MQVGKYQVHLIDTGRYRLDGGAMFGVVPQVLWKKKNPPDEKNRIFMALNTLLLKAPGRNILIDTGIGDKSTEKFRDIYGIDHSRHSLLKALAAHKIQPENVTDVILTHLHFDHVGGATYYDKEGRLSLRFPHATHYVQKKQLEWAQKRFEKDHASYLSENIDPLVKSDNLKILDGPRALFDGVELILSDGHTIAQQLVLVFGEKEKLCYAADLIPMTAHINIPWVMAYDLYPVTTIQEKKELLGRAVRENWMVFFEHDPEVCCGTIEETDKGFGLKKAIKL
ncbi:MAG: MBL fold metallo-hydrolase [Calditrichia bacterium]